MLLSMYTGGELSAVQHKQAGPTLINRGGYHARYKVKYIIT